MYIWTDRYGKTKAEFKTFRELNEGIRGKSKILDRISFYASNGEEIIFIYANSQPDNSYWMVLMPKSEKKVA